MYSSEDHSKSGLYFNFETFSPEQIYNQLLDDYLELTGSDFGYIADVEAGDLGKPSVKVNAIKDISWKDNRKETSLQNSKIFEDLNSIFGNTLKTGKVYLSNNPPPETKLSSAHEDLPPLRNFLSLPIEYRGQLIGLVGIANKTGGYSAKDVTALNSSNSMCASVIKNLQLESESEASANHLSQVIKRVTDGVVTMSATGKIVDANPGISDLFGYSSQDLTDMYVSDLMPERYRDAHNKGIARYSAQSPSRVAGSLDIETTALHKNGSEFPIALRIHEISIQGKMLFSGVIQNSKKPLSTLGDNDALEKFEAVSELTLNCICQIDNNGHVQKWNPSIAEATGVSAFSAIGQKIEELDLFESSQLSILVEKINAATKTRSSVHISLNTKNLRGLDGTITPIFPGGDKDEAIIGYFFNFSDRTEFNRKTEDILQSHKMEAFGQISARLVHDFSNLVQVIKGNIDYIDEGLLNLENTDPEMFDAWLDIKKATSKAGEITQQLISFPRKHKTQLEVIDINQAIQDSFRLFRSAVGKSIQLIFEPCSEPLELPFDESLLATAILNLCMNSRDASGIDGTIIISTHATSFKANNFAEISVKDFGSGMSEEQVEKCLQLFYTSKNSGTGLGLAMINDFTTAIDGNISIHSELGIGTTITLSIPLPDISDSSQSISPNDSVKEHNYKDNISDSKPSVLVVEDEEGVRKYAVRCVTRLGYNVIQAETAQSAIDILENNSSINIVFSDIRMPGQLDGRDLANWIAANRSAIPIILTSGYDDSDTVNAEEIDVLKKPYTLKELEARLGKISNNGEWAQTK